LQRFSQLISLTLPLGSYGVRQQLLRLYGDIKVLVQIVQHYFFAYSTLHFDFGSQNRAGQYLQRTILSIYKSFKRTCSA
jgi:hypothetical protein